MTDQGLHGAVAVVTGTAQGIGAEIATSLRAAGATVRAVDRVGAEQAEQVEQVEQAEQEGRASRSDAAVDLSDATAADAWFDALGPFQILVNVAGGVVGQTHTPLDELRDQDWNAVLDANLRTMLNCCRAAARVMKPQHYGRIVTISSGAGRSVSLTGIQAYTAAKAAQIALTRQLAHEFGPFGITVNCVAPGFVLSNPTTKDQWRSYGEDGQRDLLSRIPTGRLGTPADIARAVSFFVAPEADWVTGQTLSVDGGQSLF